MKIIVLAAALFFVGCLNSPEKSFERSDRSAGARVLGADGSGFLYQRWDGIPGSSVSALTSNSKYPGQPSYSIRLVSDFQAPPNQGSNYGAEMSGWVLAPLTGDYVVWLNSDQDGQLWVSTDESKGNGRLVALVFGQGPNTSSSGSIHLEQGRYYFIRALVKKGVGRGPGFFSAGWILPNGDLERPISWRRLFQVTLSQTSLSGLEISTGALTPAFDPTVLKYATTVRSDVPTALALPTAFESSSIITVNGIPVISATASPPIPIRLGLDTILVKVRAADGDSKTYSIIVTRTPTITQADPGVRYSWWDNLPGTQVSDLISTPNYPNHPSGTILSNAGFRSQFNHGANFGATLTGWILAPKTGDYTFWIASTDNSQLFLSSGESKSLLRMIASVPGWTLPNQWTKYPVQQSRPIPLVAGKYYYIEALMKAGLGAQSPDFVAVQWQAPGSRNFENPISAVHLFQLSQVPPPPSHDSFLTGLAVSSGALEPAFNPAQANYSVHVANSVTSVILTPTAASTATVAVNGISLANGTPSLPIALQVGVDSLTVQVTAQDGSRRFYSVTVERAPNADASLSDLTVSPGSLIPSRFDPFLHSYSVSVPYSVTSIAVSTATAAPTSIIKVNGRTVLSGSTVSVMNLRVGLNPIDVEVMAENGDMNTYSLNVTRQRNSATLDDLVISAAALEPLFAPDTQNYVSNVPSTIVSTTVTATASNPDAIITINEMPAISGAASAEFPLAAGVDSIRVHVTTPNGDWNVYTISAVRANAAVLSDLSISAGPLSPFPFYPQYSSYGLSVDGVSAATVTATALDPLAVITVNGIVVPSGRASGSIDLPLGFTTIPIEVLIPGGDEMKYWIEVSREN